MIIQQTVTIPDDHRLHLDIEVPFDIPAGRARATLTLTCEDGLPQPTADKWLNPLLGLAKAKGAKLTVERFVEIQQKEVERENENDRRLWEGK